MLNIRKGTFSILSPNARNHEEPTDIYHCKNDSNKFYIKGTYSDMWLVIDVIENRIWLRHSTPPTLGKRVGYGTCLTFYGSGLINEEIPF